MLSAKQSTKDSTIFCSETATTPLGIPDFPTMKPSYYFCTPLYKPIPLLVQGLSEKSFTFKSYSKCSFHSFPSLVISNFFAFFYARRRLRKNKELWIRSGA